MASITYTDEMWLHLHRLIDEDLLSNLFEDITLSISDNSNIMTVDEEFFRVATDNVSIIDKINLTMCVLHSGGTISINGFDYVQSTAPVYISILFNNGFITSEQETEILLPWIDMTNGSEPHFTHVE